jgi:hypothetical protein
MMTYLQIIGDFLLGTLTTAFGTLFLLTIMNALLGILVAKNKKEAFALEWKRPVAYLLFYILAHRLDALLIDNLFGWKGSTKMLMILGLIGKDIRQILTRLGEWSGQIAPGILISRITQMEKANVNGEVVDGNALDQKIENLRKNLEKLKELNRLKQELSQIGSTEESPPTPPPLVANSDSPSTDSLNILLEHPIDIKE